MALLASTFFLLAVASSSSASASAVDENYNGKCDLDMCTCFTYGGAASWSGCPDWMHPPPQGHLILNIDSSQSFWLGNYTDDPAQSYACAAYGTNFPLSPVLFKDTGKPSDQTESPMKFLGGISLENWVVRDYYNNDRVIVNYTASDPAPDCATFVDPHTTTLTPSAKSSSLTEDDPNAQASAASLVTSSSSTSTTTKGGHAFVLVSVLGAAMIAMTVVRQRHHRGLLLRHKYSEVETTATRIDV